MTKKNISQQSADLLTSLVQEVNSPLKTISLSSQKLLDAYKGKDFEYISYKDFQRLLFTLEQMNKQIQRCYHSAQSLAGLNKSTVRYESCDINAAIIDVLKLFKNKLLRSKIEITLRLSTKLPKVKLNLFDCRHIIHNILSNAMRALPAGGNIKIHTSLDNPSQSVMVEISDDGVGMSQQRLAKVFEPFFITKEQGVEKASGLGLSIVYTIVQAAGGSINVRSSLRKGTQVRMLLPVNS